MASVRVPATIAVAIRPIGSFIFHPKITRVHLRGSALELWGKDENFKGPSRLL